MRNSTKGCVGVAAAALVAATGLGALPAAAAGPSVVDPSLAVTDYASGLAFPVSMAFLPGRTDGAALVLERLSGKVQLVVPGQPAQTVLDLAVNGNSERGLLGVALHPGFATNGWVYLYWSESLTGADTAVATQTPLLGNRLDRFRWDPVATALVPDSPSGEALLRVRSLQQDGATARGNHNGGVLRFGPDGKIYLVVGDTGRRGHLQNLPCGPLSGACTSETTLVADDTFGGPAPDDAHLTGVVLRLNEDGSIPADNPFHGYGAELLAAADSPAAEQVGRNWQKVFAYGIRNSFGMAFDPATRKLWLQENGEDAYDEINRVEPGFNGGWTQIMGPARAVADFKALEQLFSTPPGSGVFQQARWGPENVADTEAEALSRLLAVPGSSYSDPEFSWRVPMPPGGIGFGGPALGAANAGDLFVGAARTFTDTPTGTALAGPLFRFDLTKARNKLQLTGALKDRVDDNQYTVETGRKDAAGNPLPDRVLGKGVPVESQDMVFGTGFGIVTDIQTGPDGALYLVSTVAGKVYRVGPRG